MILESIILDRDLTHIENLKKYEDFLPYLKIDACFTNIDNAKHYLKNKKVDIIFTGLEFIQNNSIKKLNLNSIDTEIILSLNTPSFEFKSHCMGAFDYLMKPVPFEKFIKPLNRIYTQKLPTTNNKSKPSFNNDFFFIKNNSVIEKVRYNDVLFFKGMKDYIWIQTVNKRIITLQTMKNLCENLPSDRFIRIHRSFIVSLSHIDCIDRNRIVIGKERIPIGETYRQPFFSALKELELIWD